MYGRCQNQTLRNSLNSTPLPRDKQKKQEEDLEINAISSQSLSFAIMCLTNALWSSISNKIEKLLL